MENTVRFGKLNIVIASLLFTVSWNAFWKELFLKTSLVNSINSILILVVLCLLIFEISLNIRQEYSVNLIFLAIGLIGILIVLLLLNYSLNGRTYVKRDLVTYGWLPLVILCYSFKIELPARSSQAMFILLMLPQMILGIFQHVLRQTIVPIQIGSKPFVDSIYFINGLSSNDVNYLSWGAKVRGFGMTSSGMELGSLSILILSISLNSNFLSRRVRVFLFLISVTTIVITITRNVYIVAIVVIILSFSQNRIIHRTFLKLSFLFMILFSVFGVYFNTIIGDISNLFSGLGVSTFSDRFSYINEAIQSVGKVSRLIFGGQIIPSISMPIDNSFVAMLLDKGILFFILTIVIIYSMFCYCVDRADDDTKGLITFFWVMPIISFANNVLSIFGIFLIIMVMVSNSNKLKILARGLITR